MITEYRELLHICSKQITTFAEETKCFNDNTDNYDFSIDITNVAIDVTASLTEDEIIIIIKELNLLKRNVNFIALKKDMDVDNLKLKTIIQWLIEYKLREDLENEFRRGIT